MSQNILEILNERTLQMYKDINSDYISPKNAAAFAITYYQAFSEDQYNEKLLISLMKELLTFFNKGIKFLTKKEELSKFREKMEEIIYLKDKIGIDIKKNQKKIDKSDNKMIEYSLNVEHLENMIIQIKNDLKSLEKNEDSIFQKKSLEKKEELYLTIVNLEENIDIFFENEKEKNKIVIKNLERDYKVINENLKTMISSVKNSIQLGFTEVSLKEVMQNKNSLKMYTYDIVLKNLYENFQGMLN